MLRTRHLPAVLPVLALLLPRVEAAQPDLRVQVAGEAGRIGNDVYGSGEDQALVLRVAAGEAVELEVSLENEGAATDRFSVTGTPPEGGWGLTYYDRFRDGSDVSQAVMGDGWTTPSIGAGKARRFRVSITAPAGGGGRQVTTIQATSVDGGQQDAVRIVVSFGEGRDAGGPVVAEQPGPAATETGRLAEGSSKLESGEYVQAFTVPIEADETLTIRLEPEGFGGYLAVKPPRGEMAQAQGETGEPVEVTITGLETGELNVFVTTVGVGEAGVFKMTVLPGEGTGGAAGPDQADQPPPQGSPFEREALEPAKLQAKTPTPAPDPNTDDALLGRTVHKAPKLRITVHGRHYYNETKQVEELVNGEETTVTQDLSGWDTGAFVTSEYDSALYPGSMYVPDEFAWEKPELEWHGNSFRAYQEAVGNSGAYQVDVVGTLSPEGDRLERIYVWIMQQAVLPDPEAPGTGLLKDLRMLKIVLTDLPLMVYNEWAIDQDPWSEATLAEHLEGQERRGGIVSYTYRAEGPDARDHALELRYLHMRPSFCCPDFIPRDRQHITEYRKTEWLNTEEPPLVSVTFSEM